MTWPASAFPGAEASVVAPVLIGLRHPDRPVDVLAVVWAAAAASVPATKKMLTVYVKGAKPQPLAHTRAVLSGSGKEYPHVARLCDRRDTEPRADSLRRWTWEISARPVTDADSAALVGNQPTVLRLDVTGFLVTTGRVVCAVELALFRHLVVSGLRAIDPQLVIVGGQHDWQDDWWQIPAVAA